MTGKRGSSVLTKLAPIGALAMLLGGQIGCGGAGGAGTEAVDEASTSATQTPSARSSGSPTTSASDSAQTSTARTTSANDVATGSSAPAAPAGTAPAAGAAGTTASPDTTAPAANAAATNAPAANAPAAAVPAAAAPAAAASAAPAAGGTGTIVPLYSAPGSGTWDVVAAAKRAHPSVPILAVINPNNGPGTAALSDYMAGISKLTDAGVKVIGYVFTSYGARPAADVQADMARWRSLYPGVSGIFFDEMVNKPGQESYYKGLTQAAKASGLNFTIGNPGSDGGPSYVGTVDTILVYESPGLPSAGALGGWHTSHDRQNFGIIPYGIPAMDAGFVAAAKRTCGYIFLQNDVLPNPWDTLPPYFDQLVAALG
jgi:hypothetical protein